MFDKIKLEKNRNTEKVYIYPRRIYFHSKVDYVTYIIICSALLKAIN